MHVTVDFANFVGHFLSNLVALAHAAVSLSTMGTTSSDLPPGIIG